MQTDTYNVMMKFAREQRRVDESEAQAFSRFSQSPAGRDLFAKHQAEQLGDSVSYTPPGSVAVEKSAPAATMWSGLVSGIRRITGCSESEAINKALATEEGRAAFKLCNAAEMSKNYDAGDACYYVAEANGLLANLGKAAKSTTRSKYEEMVADVRRKNPSISELKAGDLVRSTDEGKIAWQKFKEDVWDGDDPQDGEISGRPAPRFVSQQDSDMSGSRQSAGRGVVPPPPSPDNVTFKSEAAQTAEANFAFFTKVLFDASRKANKPMSIEKCISTLRACPSAAQYFDIAVAG